MTTFEQYGIVPCAYRIPVERFTQIVERDENRWCITDGACCLNTHGEWEVEPSPSNRDDSFKMRTRWTLAQAMQIAVNYFHLGFVPDPAVSR